MFREEFHDCYSEKVNLTKLSDRLKLIKAKPLIPIRSMSNSKVFFRLRKVKKYVIDCLSLSLR